MSVHPLGCNGDSNTKLRDHGQRKNALQRKATGLQSVREQDLWKDKST